MLKKITSLALTIFAFSSQFVSAQTALFSVNQSAPYCVDECIQITNLSTPPAGPMGAITGYDWRFTGGSPTSATIQFPSVEIPGLICFTEPGTYLLEHEVTGNNGGTDTHLEQIDVAECPNGLAAGFIGPAAVCVGDCITFTDTSKGDIIEWRWTFQPITGVVPGMTGEPSPEVCFSSVTTTDPIDIIFMVCDGDCDNPNSRVSTITRQIDVNDIPTVTAVPDTIIDLGEPALLTAVQTGASEISWTPSESATDPSSTSTFVFPIETTDYVITVQDGAGCTARDTVTVFLNFNPQIGVPTAFSPNGDGKNDILVVEGLALTSSIFKVYNRYGIQIFESTRQKNGWDGNYKGRPESPGVYYWTLEYEFNTGQAGTLSGNTTLVR